MNLFIDGIRVKLETENNTHIFDYQAYSLKFRPSN